MYVLLPVSAAPPLSSHSEPALGSRAVFFLMPCIWHGLAWLPSAWPLAIS